MSGNDFEFSANSFAQMRADARDKHASPSAATGKRAPAARDGGGDQRSEFAPSSSASDSDDSEDLSAISNRLKGKRPRKNVKSSGFVAAKRGGKVDRVLASEVLAEAASAKLSGSSSLRRRPETICLDEDDDYSVDSPAIIDPELQRETIRLQERERRTKQMMAAAMASTSPPSSPVRPSEPPAPLPVEPTASTQQILKMRYRDQSGTELTKRVKINSAHTWAIITQTLLAALQKTMPRLTSLTVRFDESSVPADSTPADDGVEDDDLLDVKLRFE